MAKPKRREQDPDPRTSSCGACGSAYCGDRCPGSRRASIRPLTAGEQDVKDTWARARRK